MKNQLTLLIGIVVVIVLLAYMFTFQVRYDQVAVLTTFNKVEKPTPDNPGSLIDEPGLYFKAPWPIQKVTTYSKKVQILEDQLEEIQTADGKTVILRMYLAWRIDNAYDFFRTLESEAGALDKIQPPLRHLKGVVSKYTFDQLVNTDINELKLAEIEAECAVQLRQTLEEDKAGYGIKVEQVGIRQMLLPDKTTEQVFARMRSHREALAERARSEGLARANDIDARAKSARRRILAFAETRAQAIRDEGHREAEEIFSTFREDEEFAIFLRKLETLAVISPHTTYFLDANEHWFLDLFRKPAKVAAGASGISP